jgi:hypothetical protein
LVDGSQLAFRADDCQGSGGASENDGHDEFHHPLAAPFAQIGAARDGPLPFLKPVLHVEVREPSTKHAITLQQVEPWLAGATTKPTEASKKAKLNMMLVQR